MLSFADGYLVKGPHPTSLHAVNAPSFGDGGPWCPLRAGQYHTAIWFMVLPRCAHAAPPRWCRRWSCVVIAGHSAAAKQLSEPRNLSAAATHPLPGCCWEGLPACCVEEVRLLPAHGWAACNLSLATPGGSGSARSRDDIFRSCSTPDPFAAPQAAARALEHARCVQPNSHLHGGWALVWETKRNGSTS